MNITKLKKELALIKEKLQNSSVRRTTGPSPTVERVLEPMQFSEFAKYQQKCLDDLDQCCSAIFAAPEFNEKVCLFLGGSAARLEHLPDISDFDFLPLHLVKAANANSHEEAYTYAKAHHTEFTEFKERLIKLIQNQFPGIDPKTVDVGARSVLLQFAGFLTETDVFEKLDDIDVASRASWARAVMLFEGVAWGKQNEVERLRGLSDDFYCASNDIVKGLFPGMAYAFICSFTYSCFVTELSYLRDHQKAPEQTNKNIAAAELIKAVFSRYWYSAINRILLHALFWRARIGVPSLQKQEVSEILRATPIGKLVLHLPIIMGKVIARKESLAIDLEEGPQGKREFSKFYKHLAQVKSSLTPAEGGLVFRFLQILKLCQEVRANKELDEKTLEELRNINLEMSRLLESCTWISKSLKRSPEDTQRKYDWLTARVAFDMA